MHKMTGRKIITTHVFPPIPVRSWDWCAYFDGEEERTNGHGWGRTEADAIADLKQVHGIECRQCGKLGKDVKTCPIGGCPIGADL